MNVAFYPGLGDLNLDPHAYTIYKLSLLPSPLFKDTVSFIPGWSQTNHETKNELNLLIFHLLLPEILYYKCVVPRLIATNLIASVSLLQYTPLPYSPRHGGSGHHTLWQRPHQQEAMEWVPYQPPTAYPKAAAR